MIRVGYFVRGGSGATQDYYDKIVELFEEHDEVTPVMIKNNSSVNVDLLHFNSIPVHPDPRRTNSILQNFRQTPKVVTKHGDIIFTEPHLNTTTPKYIQKYLKITQRVFSGFIDAMIAVSGSLADRLSDSLNYPRSNIYPIYHGIDKKLFRLVNEAKNRIRNKYDLGNEYILHVSNLSQKKNPNVLLEAYRESLKSHNLDLVILGDRWEEKYPNNHSHDKVNVIGWVDKEDLPYFYSAATMFFFPSLHETFGFPNLESMACGTPVITSNVYSIPEVVGDAAVTVDPRDVHGFSNAISKLANSVSLRREMSHKGLEHVKQFSWERTRDETLEVYREVIN